MMTGQLRITGHEGDVSHEWDKNDPGSVQEAERVFNDLLHSRKGMAFKMEGIVGERLLKFDPDAKEIILFGQPQGG